MKPSQIEEYLNEAISEIVDSVYFEPNDEVTHDRIKNMLVPSLMWLKENRRIEDFGIQVKAATNRGLHNAAMIEIEVKDQFCAWSSHFAMIGLTGTPISAATAPVNTNRSNPVYSGQTAGSSGMNSGQTVIQGSGMTITASTLNAGTANSMYTIATNSAYSYGADAKVNSIQSISPDLPVLQWDHLDEHGQRISMTLAPESTLSAHEALKLSLLVMATNTNPYSFSAYAYVKKHGLERHFNFKTA